MTLELIAAIASNRVIGRHNELPWHLPEDLRHFKATTMGHPIIMGRKTFDAIGKALPGRENVVLTRDVSWKRENVNVVHDPEKILTRAEGEKVFVIGGTQLYEIFLPHADVLHLTFIDDEFEGDAFFPDFETSKKFHVVQESPAQTSAAGLPYRFTKWEKN